MSGSLVLTVGQRPMFFATRIILQGLLVSSQHGSGLPPENVVQEDAKRSHDVFYALVLQVTHYW